MLILAVYVCIGICVCYRVAVYKYIYGPNNSAMYCGHENCYIFITTVVAYYMLCMSTVYIYGILSR